MKKLNLLRISMATLFLLSCGLAVFAQNVSVESDADKAKRLELERKIAEIEKQNLKLIEANEGVLRVVKAGNEALAAKRYDEAIKFFDEGLTYRADEPTFLTKKSIALRGRGTTSYNNAIQLKDETTKKSALGSAYKDWFAAVESGRKAVEILKASLLKTEGSEKERTKINLYGALLARAEALKLVVEKVDKTRLSEAVGAYRELFAVEEDTYWKNKIQQQIAKLFFSAEDFSSAKAEYRKVLVNNPDDLEANFNFAFAVVATEDKTAYKEATIALQRFLDKAPQNHSQRADAEEVMQLLKSQ